LNLQTNFIEVVIMKAINYLLAFVGGAAVGAACGLLFAPEKGSDTREKIAEALRKRGIRLNKKEMSNLVEEIAEELQSAKEEAE
jgi:gas vesicle protein